MSRVGKNPILIPDKAKVQLQNGLVLVEGPKGKLQRSVHPLIEVKVEGNQVLCHRKGDSNQDKALHGTTQRLISNMVTGVTEGFIKELEIQGVGFRAAVKGKFLNLSLGKSHPIDLPIPEGLKVTVSDNVNVKVEGIDKELVGAFSAKIRAFYPAEPYKGKGVRYKGEHILRKEGKTAQSK